MRTTIRYFLTAVSALILAIPVPAQERGSGKMQLRTVVIDPGHGGKDAGCISRDKKTYEKNITLDIGKRLAQKISAAYPDVRVIMTRTDDRFVELENRAVIANKAGADLFISIHVNSVEKGTTANGYSIHCLGQSSRKGNDLFSKNLDLCKRENSVIMLESDYQTRYQGFDPSDPQSYIIFSLMQNAHLGNSLTFAEDVAAAMGGNPIRHSRGVSQDPFWVLWRTAMPSVLIEVGFITNPDDLSTMRSESGRDKIAANIMAAFSKFKMRYDASMDIASSRTPEAEPSSPETEAPAVETAPAGGIRYGTQVLATGKKMAAGDPYFQGNVPFEVKTGKLHKYILGGAATLEEARKNFALLKKKFPDSYLVEITDGNTRAVK